MNMRCPSRRVAPPATHPVESFLEEIDDLLAIPVMGYPFGKNLSQDEQAALHTLATNHTIVIKKADKGAAVVILNRVDYLHEGCLQLRDRRYYEDLPPNSPALHDATRAVNTFVQEMILAGALSRDRDSKLIGFLQAGTNSRPGFFYLLPKIHKRNPERPFGSPGRPVCASNNHPTEALSTWLNVLLRPLLSVAFITDYLQDTRDFLQQVRDFLNGRDASALLPFTIDVEAMYTNIPHTKGRAAIASY